MDHRKPAIAFAVLAVVAALVIGSGLRARADAPATPFVAGEVTGRAVGQPAEAAGERSDEGPAEWEAAARDDRGLDAAGQALRASRAGRADRDADRTDPGFAGLPRSAGVGPDWAAPSGGRARATPPRDRTGQPADAARRTGQGERGRSTGADRADPTDPTDRTDRRIAPGRPADGPGSPAWARHAHGGR